MSGKLLRGLKEVDLRARVSQLDACLAATKSLRDKLIEDDEEIPREVVKNPVECLNLLIAAFEDARGKLK